MTRSIQRPILSGLILGMAFALGLTLASNAAVACPQPNDPKAVEFCSSNFLLASSGVSAIGGRMGTNGTFTIDYPRLPAAGTFILVGVTHYIYLPLILAK